MGSNDLIGVRDLPGLQNFHTAFIIFTPFLSSPPVLLIQSVITMSPSKVSEIVFDKFYNIVDGKQRSADNFYSGVDPTTQQNNWDVGGIPRVPL